MVCGTVMEDGAVRCPNCGQKTKNALPVVPMPGNAPVVCAGKDGYPVSVKLGLPVNGAGVAGLTVAVISLLFFWTLVPQIIALICSAIGLGNARRRCCNFSAVWGLVISVFEIVLFICFAVAVGVLVRYLQEAGITWEEYFENLFGIIVLQPAEV